MNIANADKPLSHLSKFLHLDQQSKTDTGAFSTRSSVPYWMTLAVLHGWCGRERLHDNNQEVGLLTPGLKLDYIDFKDVCYRLRIKCKASKCQMSTNSMRLARDEENCFLAESIPNYSDVVVLGKPQPTLGNNADGNDLIMP